MPQLEQSLCSASIECVVLVCIRDPKHVNTVPHKTRNRNDGRDGFMLNCSIGCKKHTTGRALIALRGL